jgi:hypothetical protein
MQVSKDTAHLIRDANLNESNPLSAVLSVSQIESSRSRLRIKSFALAGWILQPSVC